MLEEVAEHQQGGLINDLDLFASKIVTNAVGLSAKPAYGVAVFAALVAPTPAGLP